MIYFTTLNIFVYSRDKFEVSAIILITSRQKINLRLSPHKNEHLKRPHRIYFKYIFGMFCKIFH